MDNVIANPLKRQECFVLSKQKFIYIGSTNKTTDFIVMCYLKVYQLQRYITGIIEGVNRNLNK